jgi:hypothetical protein
MLRVKTTIDSQLQILVVIDFSMDSNDSPQKSTYQECKKIINSNVFTSNDVYFPNWLSIDRSNKYTKKHLDHIVEKMLNDISIFRIPKQKSVEAFLECLDYIVKSEFNIDLICKAPSIDNCFEFIENEFGYIAIPR